ncbi:MAG: hypothetical protein ACT4UQ_01705 [Gammaproteobacteria bacterium]
MAHPVHAILRRFLGDEQYAFEASTPDLWPWEQGGESACAADESGDDEEPVFFDDVYPWLEPAS